MAWNSSSQVRKPARAGFLINQIGPW